MTLYQFKLFNECDQAEITWKHAVQIAFRKDKELHYLLYQLDGFYIEFQHKAKTLALVKIRSFRSTLPLGPYLREIDVSELFSEI